MQVNSYKSNNISFGSKKVFPVWIRDKDDKPIQAWFTRFKQSDPNDRAALEKIVRKWDPNQGVYFALDILDEFNSGSKVYAIELNSKKKLPERVLCLGSGNYQNAREGLIVSRIQVSPKNLFISPKRDYKKVGTAFMYGVIKMAGKLTSPCLRISSSIDDFYEKLGMRQGGVYKVFNKSEMRKFLQNQKKVFK